jgi:16S rRNA (uracil1498-N3)-methyltransferase
MTVPRFLVPAASLQQDRAILSGAELRHLRVRRLRAGSRVVLCDGEGQERSGIIRLVEAGRAIIELADAAEVDRESPLHLSLAQASLKADKLDFVIEKAVELGVNEILVFSSERTVRPPKVERVERWQRLARSAAKQSGRSRVPEVARPLSFGELLVHAADHRLLFWEEAERLDRRSQPIANTASPQTALSGTPRSLLVTIGPEGGFTQAEVHQAAQAGFAVVSLGPRILRAETAAVVALALCQFVWGDLRPPSLAAASDRT